jgi:hypothetical protein
MSAFINISNFLRNSLAYFNDEEESALAKTTLVLKMVIFVNRFYSCHPFYYQQVFCTVHLALAINFFSALITTSITLITIKI